MWRAGAAPIYVFIYRNPIPLNYIGDIVTLHRNYPYNVYVQSNKSSKSARRANLLLQLQQQQPRRNKTQSQINPQHTNTYLPSSQHIFYIKPKPYRSSFHLLCVYYWMRIWCIQHQSQIRAGKPRETYILLNLLLLLPISVTLYLNAYTLNYTIYEYKIPIHSHAHCRIDIEWTWKW